MRIRTADMFMDFDRLRSGYVTAAQFRRCIAGVLEKNVISPLTEEEVEVLMRRYSNNDGKGEGKGGMIKWMEFCDSIDKVFGAKRLEHSPTQYIPEPHEVVKPVRPPLSPTSETLLQEIINGLKSYVKHHGSDVKTWFKDFDKHNNGYITINQFRRGLPQNLLSLEEEDLLMSAYSDDITGTVNYFKMNTDVNRKVRHPRFPASKLVPKPPNDTYRVEYVPVGTENLLHPAGSEYGKEGAGWERVEDKIRKHVYKDRIRLLEFIRDYDRHNCGIVTPSQFRAALRIASIDLDEQEFKALIGRYQIETGRMRYRDFCRSIDRVFTVTDLESHPLVEVVPPPREYLVLAPNRLTPPEEQRCSEIIARFQTLVRERRLLLAPFFQDFDRNLGTGNIGRVTRSHFSRLLSTMKLDLSDRDLHILFRKFEDAEQGKIDYMEFLRTIDPDTYVHPPPDAPMTTTTIDSAPIMVTRTPAETLTHLRTHTTTHRIRISEFFRDSDKLRSYSIPEAEFRRGVERVGAGLSEAEVDGLCERYRDADGGNFKGRTGRGKRCLWKVFVEEVEGAMSPPLTATPTVKPPTTLSGPQTSPFPPGTPLPEHRMELLRTVLRTIGEHLKLRQSSVKPFFKDFDKLSTGHVTTTQLRQSLTYIQCALTEDEFAVLCERYSPPPALPTFQTQPFYNAHPVPAPSTAATHPQPSDARVCYITFLKELEEISESELQSGGPLTGGAANVKRVWRGGMEQDLDVDARRGKEVVACGVILPLRDLEIRDLIDRIKIKAKTERIRVIDFMSDFDHLRHGKITQNEFKRALKVLYADLTEPELLSLSLLYTHPEPPTLVNYVAFSTAIESVFTLKNLEKCPTLEPRSEDMGVKSWEGGMGGVVLQGKDREVLERTMKRLVRKVKERRIDVLGYLEDFDFVREGTITTNQFRSILHSIALPVADDEIRVLAQRFGSSKGGVDRINYRAVAAAVSRGGEVIDADKTGKEMGAIGGEVGRVAVGW